MGSALSGGSAADAFAVSVLTRLLVAVSLCLTTPTEGVFPQWFSSGLAAPYRHDVLDDIFFDASLIAARYSDLTSEFESSLPESYRTGLIGADPGAGGR